MGVTRPSQRSAALMPQSAACAQNSNQSEVRDPTPRQRPQSRADRDLMPLAVAANSHVRVLACSTPAHKQASAAMTSGHSGTLKPMSGPMSSFTVTSTEQVPTLPDLSEAEHTTFVVPTCATPTQKLRRKAIDQPTSDTLPGSGHQHDRMTPWAGQHPHNRKPASVKRTHSQRI